MRNEVVAVVLVILVAGSLGVGYFTGNNNRQTMTITVTVTPNQSTPLSRSNGDWVFSIRLQNPLSLSYNLTNISGQPQTVDEVNPLINPTIYSANGTVVWAWNPTTMNYIATIPYKAGNWSAPLNIPTSSLLAGQKYVLSVFPLIGANTANGDLSVGESLMINTTITVA
jgi:hypothetical protein